LKIAVEIRYSLPRSRLIFSHALAKSTQINEGRVGLNLSFPQLHQILKLGTKVRVSANVGEKGVS
jgi:hypothetical protein